MKTSIYSLLLIGFLALISSCATTHPNEALIVGEWKPVKVEKFFTDKEEEQLKNMQSNAPNNKRVTKDPNAATSPAASPAAPAVATKGGGTRQDVDAALDRVIRAESRAPLVIYPDKTVVKLYRDRVVKATWKLRRKGTVLIAKDLVNKGSYRIDILEINDNQLIVVENLPVGGIKIQYQKSDGTAIDR